MKWEAILHRRLQNWGKWRRADSDPGLGFPKVSVYAKEYVPPLGNVWGRDSFEGSFARLEMEGDAEVLDGHMQSLRNHDPRLHTALWVKYCANAYGECKEPVEVEAQASRQLGCRVRYPVIKHWESEAKQWLLQSGVMQ